MSLLFKPYLDGSSVEKVGDAVMATSCCLFAVAPHRSAFAVAHASPE